MNAVEDEYQRGVDDYWAGSIPNGWDHVDWSARLAEIIRVPYLTGWYQASLADNGVI